MDMIKEFFGAIGGRLRSHFIGSILISLLAFNWESILFLLMDGNSVWMKIAYIEKHWQFGLPIGVGILIGILNPWIIVGGAYLAKFPSKRLHSLQDDAKHNRTIELLKNEAIENAKKAELAKSTDEALKTIDDDDIRERLKEETSTSTEDVSQTHKDSINNPYLTPDEVAKLWSVLSPLERNIVKRMGKRKGILLTLFQTENGPGNIQIDGQSSPKGSILEYSEAMETLLKSGIVQSRIPHANKVGVFELTEFGNAFSEQISQLIP